ncbi:MAG: secondary thiamine-phosphate synthase enzyme YjbQ [Candidatus Aminicenantia bacterium]
MTTSRKEEMIDITPFIKRTLEEEKIENGICIVYTPHTTAGITINENADPSVKGDILMTLNKIFHENLPYRHTEGNSPAHIKSAIIGNSRIVFVDKGVLSLGTWEGIFFCEFDGPRKRKILVEIIKK